MGKRHVALRIEVKDQILTGDHLLTHQNPLSRIDAAEFTRFQEAPLNDQALAGEVLEDDQVVMAVSQESFLTCEAPQFHIAGCRVPKRERLERRGAIMEKLRLGLLVGVELVDDIDGLRSHTEASHEVVVGGHLLGLHSRTGDQIVELNSEEDFPVIAQFRGELCRHGTQILLLLQCLAEELAQFGIDSLWIVIAEEAEARIDFLLQHLPVDAGEGRKNLNQRGEKVGALRDGLGASSQATPSLRHRALKTRSSSQDAINHEHSTARRRGSIMAIRVRIRSGLLCFTRCLWIEIHQAEA